MTFLFLTLREGGFAKMRFTKACRLAAFPFLLVFVLLSLAVTVAAQTRGPIVFHELHHDTSLPLSAYPVVWVPSHEREIKNPMRPNPFAAPGSPVTPDGALQTELLPEVSAIIGLNFDGQNADGVAPPDTNGAVGATQYVQWVNLEYNIYDKATGNKIAGPLPGNHFWSGFGGTCSTHNDGDPIIQYDKAANRWVAAQAVFSVPFQYCVAVSTTTDANGAYNRYAFSLGSTRFPDYPKMSVWPDAYYLSTNDFNAQGTQFLGVRACAMDRVNMLAGLAATIQCFERGTTDFSLLPSDLDGLTSPPSGSPAFFLELFSATTLDMFKFHVDFVNPGNSTFTGPISITVPSWTQLCPFTRACIPQPSPGEKVDSLGDRMMYRLAYRNFGDHEAMVAAHSVDRSSGVAGVRWYEIRDPNGTPTVFQRGTVKNLRFNLWLPSIAMDKVGDIAVGFSASSTALDPSVVFTGRVPTDPPNTMEALKLIVKGTGVQTSTANRWGDYAAVSVDPVDDCTMWFTTEYIKTTGSFNWSTRIANFKFPTCQ
jgi:hypothetical protein